MAKDETQAKRGKKPTRDAKQPKSSKGREAASRAPKMTTYATRFTDEQIELIKRAAEIRRWSLAQFMQHAVVQRAAEVINRHEDRKGMSEVSRELVRLLAMDNPKPSLSLIWDGAHWDTAEPKGVMEDWDDYGEREVNWLPRAYEDNQYGGFLEIPGSYLRYNGQYVGLYEENKNRLSIYKHGLTTSELVGRVEDPEGFELLVNSVNGKHCEVTVQAAIPDIGLRRLRPNVPECAQMGGREFGDMLVEGCRSQDPAHRATVDEFVDPDALLQSGGSTAE